MSLLNNVLRDLQSRGAFGLPPLTGLEPVTETADQQRKRALLLPALAVLSIALAVVVWRPVIDGRESLSFANIMTDAATQPQSEPRTDVEMSPQAEPAIAATGDDLRDVFNIDSASNESLAPVDDYVVDDVADAPLASAATVVSPVAEPMPAAELPVVTETPAVKERPAVIESPGTTTISRRKTDDNDTSGIVAMALAAMRSNELYTAERLFRDALAVDSGDSAIWSYLYGVSGQGGENRSCRTGFTTRPGPGERARCAGETLCADAAGSWGQRRCCRRTEKPPADARLGH